jgi:hypothetical protein
LHRLSWQLLPLAQSESLLHLSLLLPGAVHLDTLVTLHRNMWHISRIHICGTPSEQAAQKSIECLTSKISKHLFL